MIGTFCWGRAQFIGPWTEDDALAFVERVKQLAAEEARKAPPAADPPVSA